MSADLPAERIARLTGFGLHDRADGYLFRPTRVEEIREVLRLARTTGRRVVLRGAGRSYGDASLGSERIVLDLSRMDRILSWDPSTGVFDGEAGVTIERLWRHTIEDGWWPPVVSGTMAPTLAGALAMNVHGKNHPRAGTLGEHVVDLDVLLATGELRTLTPEDEAFRAIVGSAGLLGIIVRARLRMRRVASGDVRVLAASPRNWDEQFDLFERFDDADTRLGWVDGFARGREAGRGQFHATWSVERRDPASLRPEHQDPPDTALGFFPKSALWRVLKPFCNRPGMRLLSAARARAGRLLGDREFQASLVASNFMLDYVPHWRNAYLPGGLVQVQGFVPKERARDVFARQVEAAQAARLEPFLGVLKRHRSDPFLMSYGVDGYSLALDFKVPQNGWPRLEALCRNLNGMVAEAGGRFYLAKDSTLRPEDLRASLGDETLAAFRRLKAEFDPEGLLTSDLARRVGLDPASAHALRGPSDSP